MTLSDDLRQRATQAYRNKEGSQREIARRFKIARSTLQLWLQELETPRAPRPETRGRPAALGPSDLERLSQLVTQHPEASAEQLASMLAGSERKPVARSTMSRALAKLDLSRKKRQRAASADATQRAELEGGLGEPAPE